MLNPSPIVPGIDGIPFTDFQDFQIKTLALLEAG